MLQQQQQHRDVPVDDEVDFIIGNGNRQKFSFSKWLHTWTTVEDRGAADVRFLMLLLRDADADAADKLSDYQNPIFREKLEEVITTLQWPYAKLKQHFKPVDEDEDDDNNRNQRPKRNNRDRLGRVSLNLADVDLLTLPKCLIRGTGANWSLVSLNVSFNANLQDLDEEILEHLGPYLNSLTCRNCGISDIRPIFRHLPNLNFLDISFNQIPSVSDLNRAVGSSSMAELRSLWMIGNPFGSAKMMTGITEGGANKDDEKRQNGSAETDFDPQIFRRYPKLKEIVVEAEFVKPGSVAATAGFQRVSRAATTFKRIIAG